jgi:hypothetical protein
MRTIGFWALAMLAGCDGEMSIDGTDAGARRDGGGARDGGAPPDGYVPSDGGPGTDGGDLPPPETLACDDDGTCDPGETCASCRADCGSCEIEDLPMQRAKYVDGACETMGDGLSDECAAAAGGAGRFNELQAALDSLEAGDTLYIHPGDYWRDVEGRDSGGIFTSEATGTAERPIVLTARDRADPPTIHSCNPEDPSVCPMPALAAYGNHTIVDHLHIRGRVQIWGGTGLTMQYLECTRGWGVGDGNASCLRIDSCTDCTAHHNYVHSIEGTRADPDRPSGLKEFQSVRAIWEFNTVLDVPHWAYDLHRNSEDTIVRFNFFAGFDRQAIYAARTRNIAIYGNVLVGIERGGENCIGVWGRNENAEGEPHLVEIHHNVCARIQGGLATSAGLPTQLFDNVVTELRSLGEQPRNVIVAEDESELDHNAYDSAGNFRREEFEASTFSDDLAAWRAATGWDAESESGEGGACELVGSISDREPTAFRVAEGPCRTMARDGGEIGAYGATSCVGHACP